MSTETWSWRIEPVGRAATGDVLLRVTLARGGADVGVLLLAGNQGRHRAEASGVLAAMSPREREVLWSEVFAVSSLAGAVE